MFTQRKAYEDKMDTELKTWEARIDDLRVPAANVEDGHKKVEMDSKIEEAQKDQERVRAQLDELKISTDDKWQELRQRLDKSWDEMITAWQRSFARSCE